MGPGATCDNTVQRPSRTTLDIVQIVSGQRAQSPNASPKCPVESQTKQWKRKTDLPVLELQPAKRQHKSILGAMQEELLARAIQSIDHIVTLDNIIFIQERLILLRDASFALGNHDNITSKYKAQQQDMCCLRGLERSWSFIGFSGTDERWVKSLWRVYAGRFYGQYINERNTYSLRKQKENLPHPIETYIDLCWPETITPRCRSASQNAMTA